MSLNPLNAARVDVWMLKEINWRAHPSEPMRRVKIVMQTLNGPCSFIALCNILILRGDIEIQPPDRKEAAYEFLSSLVGDWLIRASPDGDIEAALSILPMTQNGLDLNPLFTAESSFRPTGDGAALKLFDQAKVKLVHGWLCDPNSAEYVAILSTQDYDSSIDLVVEADSLTKGKLVKDWENPDSPVQVGGATGEEIIPPEAQGKVQRAIVVNRFLQSTQSQLTYYGLFTLSASLKPGELVALFRNSHLAVLHKPHDRDDGLYLLVTDHTFAREEAVVWEKLEDIEGGSQFVDAEFKDSVPVGGDFAGETAESVANVLDRVELNEVEAQDQALARQLQAEEDAHAEAMYRAEMTRQRETPPPPPPAAPTVLPRRQKKKECMIM